MLQELLNALEESLFMICSSGLISGCLGLPLGVLLYCSHTKKLLHYPSGYLCVKTLVECTRSIPYAALSIALIPLTHALLGSSAGTLSAIIPLSLIGIPQFAHLSHQALCLVPLRLIETSQALGANTRQLIFKILIPESAILLIQGFGNTLVQLISYSTIAGLLGGGGLGHLLTYKGYAPFQAEYVFSVVVILVLLVQCVQRGTHYIANSSTEIHEG